MILVKIVETPSIATNTQFTYTFQGTVTEEAHEGIKLAPLGLHVNISLLKRHPTWRVGEFYSLTMIPQGRFETIPPPECDTPHGGAACIGQGDEMP